LNLEKIAKKIRANILVSLYCSGSGHTGGSLSAVELVVAAYLKKMRHNPQKPGWADRDRFYFSAGHKAPLWYAMLGYLGYFDLLQIATLRKLGSPFQGHPDRNKLKGVELSCGSLGQGLSFAVGDACAAKMNNKDYKIFCLMGDGEQQEGQIWEAVMAASHHKLGNLIGIVDKNRLQIDGNVKEVMNIDDLGAKYRAFGWRVLECNGHNFDEILGAYDKALEKSHKPAVIIADTIKGKGVSFAENQAGWHGKTPNKQQLDLALKEIAAEGIQVEKMIEISQNFQEGVEKKLSQKMPKFSRNYWWNTSDNMKVVMKATRAGFGEALKNTKNEKVCTIGSDLSESVCIDQFYKDNKKRQKRFFSMGIAEQSGVGVAAGMAKNGDIPFYSAFGIFASGRAYDQIRNSIAYGKMNAKIGGSHSGVTVGEDGATHQALEDIAIINSIPGITFFVPCDNIETQKVVDKSIAIDAPCYIRYTRVGSPVISTKNTPFEMGRATLISYLKEEENFIDAYKTEFADIANVENFDICIVACGPIVAEGIRASWILKEEFGLTAKVLNFSTVKPFDGKAIEKIATKAKVVLTAEEHQKGGFGNLVAAKLLGVGRSPKFGMIGVDDSFGCSGSPWELMKHFGLTAEFIAKKGIELYKK